ncbi:amidase signature domain-containing protein [Lentinula edodes]|uniref:amidase signature domain-containing protein n=1 Tax=Lentinula edodes TaxID=5353 RepID=UPI001E8D9E81|nr:amidase signature domain-containing protein [Lentinula edodes]KAH7873758.1 amidase signature domain-containing protein [Lentinula edodes]KAJ3915914.1 amidase signature domain-containing protein [Lentinula edodes]
MESLYPSWPQAARNAVAERDASIPADLRLPLDFIASYPAGSDVLNAAATSGLLSEKELQITDTSSDATAILSAIKNKDVTAVEVLTAFMKRAAIAHQLLCCLTQISFEEGLARAKELDDYYERTGELAGPLHGLPISVKDYMGLKGKRATGGFSGDLDRLISTENSPVNQILWDAGCVFYCKTNVPQSMMHLETKSFWGQTLNPYNTHLTSGGSSGGCGALVAFGGSPLSIGSDIGGSLRSPASCCGIYTLKPTTGRLPSNGLPGCGVVPGNDAILATCGPLARSSRDIVLFFDVVLKTQPWLQDMGLVPLPWKPENIKWTGKIRLGVMWDDGNVQPQPPVRRALKAMTEALKRTNNFDIVDYDPKFHKELVLMAQSLYFTDGGASVHARAAVTGEPLCHLTEWVISLPGVKDHTSHQLWELLLERDALRAKYYSHWNSQNIDVLLCPVQYGAAQPLQTTKYWGYTSAFNCADFPAAVFPTGLKASATLDPKDTEPREAWSEADAYCAAAYDPLLSNDAPLSLQLVSKRHADEVVMQALREIEKVLPLRD